MDKELEELLGTVTAKLNKVSSEFSTQAEKALKEAQNAGTLSSETKASVDKLATDFNALKGTADEIKSRLGEVEQQAVRNAGPAAREMPKSFGQQVVANEGLDQFKARIAGNERARLSIPVRAALTSPGVADGVVQPQRDTNIDVAPKQRLFIRDLITGGRTTAPAIFWVQETGFTNNAAVVPENTKKPESTIAFATKITPVTTIAHLFKASKQIMDDFSQLSSLVDAEMRYGLSYVEEQEILFGDGTGAHLHGIVPQASAFNPAFEVANGTGIDDLRLAMLQAQLARYPATGFVLHFVDWAKVELTKDSTGQYLFANPLRLASPTLWGLPVVPTETPAFLGKFLTGAFQAGAQIFDREDANVVISSENNDDFEKNMLTVRCEERLALAVKRPEAFVYGSFTPAT
ncbi:MULTISPECIES: phage major capsid protein [unclassified Caballeronia]|uniref:phage major capsid protein n=1 Tax=unclassified Caballeronia TaxID=2646786 RepID=UPI00285EE757|nr:MULTISPECIES: phage major capsid protein [unclassified Caballeronia]MDR5774903.1 phage major capsid protein [Caballeronia sp. LZ002]MDR5801196.1 phage major capsid protein [Caballeronia sp. LZ001]MDR5850339.1 phage major capsid protein [Caballeronia sp. LZ003]